MSSSDDLSLCHIYNNADINQRQLTAKTSLSLGTVNIILHRLVSRGLVKIEKISSRQLRYILTPQGLALCTKKTLGFVKQAYQQIAKLQSIYAASLARLEDTKAIYLFGKKDEIYEILAQTKTEGQVFYVDEANKIKKGQDTLAIIWQEEAEAACLASDIPYLHIIRELDPAETM